MTLTLIRGETSTLADAACARLAADILDGRFDEGEALDLHGLASQLGISRMPLREAVQRLAALRLIDIEVSRWTKVAHITETTNRENREVLAHMLGMMLWMGLPAHGDLDAHADALLAAAPGKPMLAAVRALADELIARAGNAPLARIWEDVSLAVRYHLRDALTPPADAPSALAAALRGRDPAAASTAARALCGV